MSLSEKYNSNQAWLCDLRNNYKDQEFKDYTSNKGKDSEGADGSEPIDQETNRDEKIQHHNFARNITFNKDNNPLGSTMVFNYF